MKTLRRLLYREIVGSVAFVALAFLSLFVFIDLVEELGRMAQRGRTLAQALEAVAGVGAGVGWEPEGRHCQYHSFWRVQVVTASHVSPG